MPGNTAGSAIGVSVFLQAGLFFCLLLAASVLDLRFRQIPDRLQAAIAVLTFLCFSPVNLLGVFGALPYVITALFYQEMGGMGGGDIKLAGAVGVILGLPASLLASIIGLGSFVLYGSGYTMIKRLHGQKKKTAFPMAPFLSFGAACAYFMKLRGMIW
ncbi:prepilin peptidase [Hungatella hathewayi]